MPWRHYRVELLNYPLMVHALIWISLCGVVTTLVLASWRFSDFAGPNGETVAARTGMQGLVPLTSRCLDASPYHREFLGRCVTLRYSAELAFVATRYRTSKLLGTSWRSEVSDNIGSIRIFGLRMRPADRDQQRSTEPL